jgi:hypothetical protein
MLTWFLAMILALTCPNHTNKSTTHDSHNQVTTLDDTGGDTGNIPPTGPPHK